MLCLFVNFYEYLLYVFEVDGVPIGSYGSFGLFLFLSGWSYFIINEEGLGHAFPESPKYRHNTSLGI